MKTLIYFQNLFPKFIFVALALVFSNRQGYSQTTMSVIDKTNSIFTIAEQNILATRFNEVTPTGKIIGRQCVTINSSMFNTSIFTVTMPNGDILTCNVVKELSDPVVDNAIGKITLINGIQNRDNGNFAFTYKDNYVSGFINYGQNFYTFYPIKDGYALLSKLNSNEAIYGECGFDDLSVAIQGSSGCSTSYGGLATARILMLFSTQALTFPEYVNTTNPDFWSYFYLAFEAWPIVNSYNVAGSNSHIEPELYPVYDFQGGFSFSTETDIQDKINADISTLENNTIIEQKRDDNHCDAVAFFVDDRYSVPNSTIFGSVGTIGEQPNNPNKFIVVRNSALGPRWTFAHEFAHLSGARHTRDSDPTNVCHHGFHFTNAGQNRTTILGSTFVSGTRTRIQYFSNQYLTFNGTPIGDANNDNASTIDDETVTMSNIEICNRLPSIPKTNMYPNNEVFIPASDPNAYIVLYPCVYGPLENAYVGSQEFIQYKWYINNILVQTTATPSTILDFTGFPIETIIPIKIVATARTVPFMVFTPTYEDITIYGNVYIWQNGAPGFGTNYTDQPNVFASSPEIYPSITRDIVNLHLPINIHNVDLHLYNSIGQLVKSYGKISTNSQISLSDLKSGIYVAIITSEGNKPKSIKLSLIK